MRKKIPFVSSACKHRRHGDPVCVVVGVRVRARPHLIHVYPHPTPVAAEIILRHSAFFFFFFRADRSSAASESLAKLQGQRTRGRLCSLHSPPAHSRDLPPGFLVQSERNSTTGSRGGLIVKTEQPCLIYAPSSFTETFLGGHLSTFKRR